MSAWRPNRRGQSESSTGPRGTSLRGVGREQVLTYLDKKPTSLTDVQTACLADHRNFVRLHCSHPLIDQGVTDPPFLVLRLFSSGFGKELSLALLARGDKVISTARARSLPKLTELKEKGAETLELDVTAPLSELHVVAAKAVAIYGHIDVVVNNAGYILSGVLEENTCVTDPASLPIYRALYPTFTSPEQTYEQFNTNVFGCLNVARAFLPYMRPRKTGTIVWIGSIGGYRSANDKKDDSIRNNLVALFLQWP